MRTALLTTATAATFAFGLALNANAAPQQQQQSSAPPGMTQQQPKSQKHVSQKELKKFAATYQDVTQIRDKYTSKLQGAKDKKHAQKIASQAQDKMKSAIKNHGFTLSEYTDVVKAINSNPKLQKQFLKMTKGSSGASSSS